MNKVVDPTETTDWDREVRRAQVIHNRNVIRKPTHGLTPTGEMRIIQRRAEKQWHLENDDTIIIPRIEL